MIYSTIPHGNTHHPESERLIFQQFDVNDSDQTGTCVNGKTSLVKTRLHYGDVAMTITSGIISRTELQDTYAPTCLCVY